MEREALIAFGAAWGAIVATFTLLWQAGTWWKSRRSDLVLGLQYRPETSGEQWGGEGQPASLSVVVRPAVDMIVTECGLARLPFWRLRRERIEARGNKPGKLSASGAVPGGDLPQNVKSGGSLSFQIPYERDPSERIVAWIRTSRGHYHRSEPFQLTPRDGVTERG